MDKSKRIFVAGHRGLVGAAVVRRLRDGGYHDLVLRTHAELDLTDQAAVRGFFARERPAAVILAAARVGGIYANDTQPASFIHDNIAIQDNVIDAAQRSGVEKFVFLGSSCIYPKLASQPIKEEYLLTGPLEPTNEWYAIAKIAGLKTCEAYRRQYGLNAIALMPTNLYGPGDNFDLRTSHVLPALIRKFHEAKIERRDAVGIWGTGLPRREFLYVDDLADAVTHLLETYNGAEMVNVGWGTDVSVRELAELVGSIVGFEGRLEFDLAKPDGTPRKLLDVARLSRLGWRPKVALREGIERTYAWFRDHVAELRRTE